MRVTNQTARTLEIAATGQVVEPGAVVEVDDALGRSLCEQVDVWAKAPTTKSETTKTGTAGASKED